mmetsp:Transcript_37932/g.81035  ORF Transcript_37932/g.81035 Transcript_37932/m.81035 type:complete len:184 (+) Transcript_37932:300-851(+)
MADPTAGETEALPGGSKHPLPTGKGEPVVSLYKFTVRDSSICGGFISGGQRICVTALGLCPFKHSPKLHSRLAPGYYIFQEATWGVSIFEKPTISARIVGLSSAFAGIKESTLPLSMFNCLLMMVIDGSLEELSASDLQDVIGQGLKVDQPQAKTSCKRVRLFDLEEEGGMQILPTCGGNKQR